MKYSDSTDLTGLVEDIDFLCGTDSTSYPIKDKTRNANRHYYKAVIDALTADGRQQYDDPALGSVPSTTFNLLNGTRDYKIEGTSGNLAGFLKMNAVEVKDISGNWIRLKEMDISDLDGSITDFMKTAGIPQYYDISGNYISLYPAPDTAQVTATNGIKVWFQREINVFGYGDTSPEPGIPEPFQRIISLGAAYDWLLINDVTGKSDRILAEYKELRAELRAFYSTKNTEVQPDLRPAHRQSDYL